MNDLITPLFESTLLRYIKETFLPQRFHRSQSAFDFNEKDVRFFANGAAQLSQAFTSGRRLLPKNYFNKKEYRSAYLLYFTLTNFAKVIKCLDETARLVDPQARRPAGESVGPPVPDTSPSSSGINVLDVGCGPGTASLACSSFFSKRLPATPLSITAIDQNREILRDARALLSLNAPPHHTTRVAQEMIGPRFPGRSLKGKSFDLIIAANFLNEIGSVREQVELCQTLTDRYLNPRGILIVLDPALQKTTRALMEVRDLLHANILSPCLHQQPCPMLAHNRRDWCHFYLEWNCPRTIRKVDHLLGIKHDYLKMAYLIAQKSDPAQDERNHVNLWRVVSSPLKSKGRCEFVLCGQGCLRRISRLDRDRSDLNAKFDMIKRGDIIRIGDCIARLSKDDSLEIRVPFNSISR